MGRIFACLALTVLVLGGCQQIRNEDAGAIVGGGLGAVLGSQVGDGRGRIVAAAVGTLAGALIGSRVGRTMDEVDRLRANRTLETARTGTTESWENPDSGARYRVTPTRTYENKGTPCRDYQTEAWIDGKRETVVGTACRQSDGTWQTT